MNLVNDGISAPSQVRTFVTRFSDLSGRRWDALYYSGDIFKFLSNCPYITKKLRDLVSYFSSGFAAGRAYQSDAENGVIQIRPTNINDERGELVFHRNVFIPKDELVGRKDDILRRGEVLFNNTNSQEQVGKTVFFDLNGDFFSSNHITRIATLSALLNPEYLAFLLNLFQERKVFFKLCTNWNNQSGVGVDVLGSIPIPLPALSIQETIVAKLHAALQEKRDKQKQALELFASIEEVLLAELGIASKPTTLNMIENRIFKRHFSEITGGRLDPIANQPKRVSIESTIISGKYPTKPLYALASFRKDIVNSISPGISYIGLENIDGLTGQYVETSEKESISSALIFSPRQILFPKLRPYLNKTHLAAFSGLCSTEFHVLDAHAIRPEFLTEFLRSRATVALTSLLMTGNTLPRLQLADIERLQIPVPPLKVQEELIARIAEIRRSAYDLFKDAHINLKDAMNKIEAMILGVGDKS